MPPPPEHIEMTKKKSIKKVATAAAKQVQHTVKYTLTSPKSHRKDGHRKLYVLPVMVYLTREQKKLLTERAQSRGLSLSAFLREQALEQWVQR